MLAILFSAMLFADVPFGTKEKAPHRGAFFVHRHRAAYATFGSLNASISSLYASTGMQAHMTFLSP